MEGTQDRPGTNYTLKFLQDRLWNYNAEQTSSRVKLINKSGAVSVRGELVEASTTTDNAVSLSTPDSNHAIGIFDESGVADGDYVWISCDVIVYVMLKDGTAGTHGNWVKTSDVAGRADATQLTPPAGGVALLDEHMQELGHCLESIGAGTDVLCKIIMNTN